MQADDVIRSERLDLPLLSLEQLDNLAAGDGASVGAVHRAAEAIRGAGAHVAGHDQSRPTSTPTLPTATQLTSPPGINLPVLRVKS